VISIVLAIVSDAYFVNHKAMDDLFLRNGSEFSSLPITVTQSQSHTHCFRYSVVQWGLLMGNAGSLHRCGADFLFVYKLRLGI
jgi:hypothetical protein